MCEAAETTEAISPDVVTTLVANHRQFLNYIERRVGNRSVAEDILQDAFAKGIEKIETLRDDESVMAWFYRALRNSVIDYYRRRDSASRALGNFMTESLHTAELQDEDLKGNICRCISNLAATLSEDYAEALRRIELEEVPVKQFAEEKGISRSNAAVRVFRARQALRRQLARSCGTCAEHGCLDCSCSRASGSDGGYSGH